MVLSGFVYRPGAFEYHAGMRLSDVINSVDELRPTADRHYVMIRRTLPPSIEKCKLFLQISEKALSARGPPQILCFSRGTAYLFFDLTADRERTIGPIMADLAVGKFGDESMGRGFGRRPGEESRGNIHSNPKMRVSDLIRGRRQSGRFGLRRRGGVVALLEVVGARNAALNCCPSISRPFAMAMRPRIES